MSSGPAKSLFEKDGVSLLATILPVAAGEGSNDNTADDDNENDGIILTLTLHRHHEKNVINPTMISLLVEALDTIESHPLSANTNNKALIITGLSLDENEPTSKFFSNGLDLQWMLRANDDNPGATNHEIFEKAKSDPKSAMIESFNSLVLARILTLPFRTVAAINGHCIGAGLFLSLACDYRIMRSKRGFVQWPEARLGMRLTKGFSELSKAKIGNGKGPSSSDHHVLREGILTAKKYTSTEAVASGIIDLECPIEELYVSAFQLAREGLPESLNLEYFDPKGYSEIKMEMYTDAYRALKFGKVADLPHSRI